MMFPKGDRKAERRAADREAARARRECIESVWKRDDGRCRYCRRACVEPKDAYSPAQQNVGHAHDIILRSLGGDSTDPDLNVLVCNECHDRLHRKRYPWLKVTILEPDLGARGELDWVVLS